MTRAVGFALLFACLAGICLLAVTVGPAHLSPARAWKALLSPSAADEAARTIVWQARLPRLCLAMLVGAALSVAGAVMQAFFQNPMAAPSVIGVSAGAWLGAAAAIASGIAARGTPLTLPASAFAGACTIAVLVYALSRRGATTPVTILLLTGIALGSLASAIASLIMIRCQRGDLDLIMFWMLGSFANRGWPEAALLAPYALAGTAAAWAYARYLDVLSLGDEQATYLGLDVARVRLGFLALSALLAAAAVSVSGVIGFIGLVVPHIARLIFGAPHRTLIPAAALLGMAALAAADIAANLAGEIPVGVVTALMGAPFFLYLLHRRETYRL